MPKTDQAGEDDDDDNVEGTAASVVAAGFGGNNVAVGKSTSVNVPSIGRKSKGEAREARETNQEAARSGGDGGCGTGTTSSRLFLYSILFIF